MIFNRPSLPSTVSLLTSMFIAISLSGCASTIEQDNDAKVAKHDKTIHDLITTAAPRTTAKIHADNAPLDIAPLDPLKQQAMERAWLRAKKVDFIPNRKNPAPIAANEILKMFRENGINITSALPLDSYTYNGNGVKSADGETALQLILGQMGLDYETDEKGKYVTVIPMQSKSWVINLGNRTSFSTNSSFDSLCSLATTSSNSQQGGSGNSGSSGTGGSSPSGQASQSGQAAGGTGNVSNVQTQENFWGMLTTELNQRLQVLLPVTAGMPASNNTAGQGQGQAQPFQFPGAQAPGYQVPGLAGGATGGTVSSGGGGLYTRQQIGHFAINPVTGAVTIQAPSWMLRQIQAYMDDVIMPMFNTSMTFEGTVANVRSSSDKSTGFDLTALASFAGRYGVALNNNILGGISMSTTNGITAAITGSASTLPGSGSAFGVISAADNLQIFNAFLTTLGGTEILTRPIVTVTSGVPVDFGRLVPIFTNEQTSTLSQGGVGSGAIATIQNNIVERKYGSLLRIMPHYDPISRRVRAQVSLLQRPLVGFQNLTISLVGVSGGIQNQTVRIPQIECGVTSTEAILDDGELIVIGGQVENTTDSTHAGVTGAMTVPLLDLFTSQTHDTGSKTTMYFALRVRLNSKMAK